MRADKYLISSTLFLGDISSKEKTSLLEFPVTPSTECSRVSSRSYVFTLDTDSLLITFANEAGEPIFLLAAQASCVKSSYIIKMYENVCFYSNNIHKSIPARERISADTFVPQIFATFIRT